MKKKSTTDTMNFQSNSTMKISSFNKSQSQVKSFRLQKKNTT